MIRQRLIGTAAFALALFVANLSQAATIPAGTTLIVQTAESISSVDVVGTRFPVQLAQNVVIDGKVVLHAGTKFTGRVVTARRLHSSNQRFTVDLVEAVIGGHAVPIKTTGAFQLDNTRFKTKNNVSVSRAGYMVGVGTMMQFHLAQPVRL